MKKSLLFFATLGYALAAPAQPAVSQPASAEAMKAHPVASPSRTRSAELATVTKRDKHHRHHKDGLDELVWVDATGKTVGRFYDPATAVVAFNGQLAFVRGLTTVTCEPSGGPCSYAGGSRWRSLGNMLFYASSDCTGPVYSSPGTGYTPYFGFPVTEEEVTYIYFFRGADKGRVMLNSYAFESNQCRALPQGFSEEVVPVSGVVPASAVGVEPYAVK